MSGLDRILSGLISRRVAAAAVDVVEIVVLVANNVGGVAFVVEKLESFEICCFDCCGLVIVVVDDDVEGCHGDTGF